MANSLNNNPVDSSYIPRGYVGKKDPNEQDIKDYLTSSGNSEINAGTYWSLIACGGSAVAAILLCFFGRRSESSSINKLSFIGFIGAIASGGTAAYFYVNRLQPDTSNNTGAVKNKQANQANKVRIESLIETLKDKANPDTNKRIEAARELGASGDINAFSPLGDALADTTEDTGVRVQAAVSLGELGAFDKLDQLIICLNDHDPQVQCAAAQALGVLISKDPQRADKAMKPLGQFFKKAGQSKEGKCAAVTALSHFPANKVGKFFIDNINEGDPDVRGLIVTTLCDFLNQTQSPQIIGAMRNRLKTENDPSIAQCLIAGLSNVTDLNEQNQIIISLITVLKTNTNDDVKIAAITALRKLCSNRTQAATILPEIDKIAQTAAGNLKTKAETAARDIRLSLGLPALPVPVAPLPPPTSPALSGAVAAALQILLSPSSNAIDKNTAARTVLGSADCDKAVQQLIGSLNDSKESVRTAAAGALFCLVRNDTSPNKAKTQQVTVPLIQFLNRPGQRKFLLDNINEPSSDIRFVIISKLCELLNGGTDKEILTALHNKLQTESDPSIIRQIVLALGSVTDTTEQKKLIPTLISTFKRCNNPDVCKAIIQVLGKFKAADAIELLSNEGLKHADQGVRLLALNTLKDLCIGNPTHPNVQAALQAITVIAGVAGVLQTAAQGAVAEIQKALGIAPTPAVIQQPPAIDPVEESLKVLGDRNEAIDKRKTALGRLFDLRYKNDCPDGRIFPLLLQCLRGTHGAELAQHMADQLRSMHIKIETDEHENEFRQFLSALNYSSVNNRQQIVSNVEQVLRKYEAYKKGGERVQKLTGKGRISFTDRKNAAKELIRLRYETGELDDNTVSGVLLECLNGDHGPDSLKAVVEAFGETEDRYGSNGTRLATKTQGRNYREYPVSIEIANELSNILEKLNTLPIPNKESAVKSLTCFVKRYAEERIAGHGSGKLEIGTIQNDFVGTLEKDLTNSNATKFCPLLAAFIAQIIIKKLKEIASGADIEKIKGNTYASTTQGPFCMSARKKAANVLTQAGNLALDTTVPPEILPVISNPACQVLGSEFQGAFVADALGDRDILGGLFLQLGLLRQQYPDNNLVLSGRWERLPELLQALRNNELGNSRQLDNLIAGFRPRRSITSGDIPNGGMLKDFHSTCNYYGDILGALNKAESGDSTSLETLVARYIESKERFLRGGGDKLAVQQTVKDFLSSCEVDLASSEKGDALIDALQQADSTRPQLQLLDNLISEFLKSRPGSPRVEEVRNELLSTYKGLRDKRDREKVKQELSTAYAKVQKKLDPKQVKDEVLRAYRQLKEKLDPDKIKEELVNAYRALSGTVTQAHNQLRVALINLGAAHPRDNNFISALVTCASNENDNPTVRLTAIEALGKCIAGTTDFNTLVTAGSSSILNVVGNDKGDKKVRTAAIKLLGNVSNTCGVTPGHQKLQEDIVQQLIGCLDAKNPPEVQAAAREALLNLNKTTVQQLRNRDHRHLILVLHATNKAEFPAIRVTALETLANSVGTAGLDINTIINAGTGQTASSVLDILSDTSTDPGVGVATVKLLGKACNACGVKDQTLQDQIVQKLITCLDPTHHAAVQAAAVEVLKTLVEAPLTRLERDQKLEVQTCTGRNLGVTAAAPSPVASKVIPTPTAKSLPTTVTAEIGRKIDRSPESPHEYITRIVEAGKKNKLDQIHIYIAILNAHENGCRGIDPEFSKEVCAALCNRLRNEKIRRGDYGNPVNDADLRTLNAMTQAELIKSFKDKDTSIATSQAPRILTSEINNRKITDRAEDPEEYIVRLLQAGKRAGLNPVDIYLGINNAHQNGHPDFSNAFSAQVCRLTHAAIIEAEINTLNKGEPVGTYIGRVLRHSKSDDESFNLHLKLYEEHSGGHPDFTPTFSKEVAKCAYTEITKKIGTILPGETSSVYVRRIAGMAVTQEGAVDLYLKLYKLHKDANPQTQFNKEVCSIAYGALVNFASGSIVDRAVYAWPWTIQNEYDDSDQEKVHAARALAARELASLPPPTMMNPRAIEWFSKSLTNSSDSPEIRLNMISLMSRMPASLIDFDGLIFCISSRSDKRLVYEDDKKLSPAEVSSPGIQDKLLHQAIRVDDIEGETKKKVSDLQGNIQETVCNQDLRLRAIELLIRQIESERLDGDKSVKMADLLKEREITQPEKTVSQKMIDTGPKAGEMVDITRYRPKPKFESLLCSVADQNETEVMRLKTLDLLGAIGKKSLERFSANNILTDEGETASKIIDVLNALTKDPNANVAQKATILLNQLAPVAQAV